MIIDLSGVRFAARCCAGIYGYARNAGGIGLRKKIWKQRMNRDTVYKNDGGSDHVEISRRPRRLVGDTLNLIGNYHHYRRTISLSDDGWLDGC